ncbi:MAG TPA: acyl-CoA dehydrogenase family protein, partial [Beijerinckiaceae bacterium]|nr:acyl-CoA dehydrogenase family protein [Beijerinckiaceae bacterium]
MHFSLTEEEEMIRDTARRIAAERLAPLAERLDRGEGREEHLSNLKLLAENGFMALN